MIMCIYLSYLTHFSGYGRNHNNTFVAFLENLRHHNFVLRLSDLYRTQIDDTCSLQKTPNPKNFSNRRRCQISFGIFSK